MNFLTDPIGTKYGCTYKYNSSTPDVIGTFTPITGTTTNGRLAKDPIEIAGHMFIPFNVPMKPMIETGNDITMLTSYTYPTSETLLTTKDGTTGVEETTKEAVDFSKFKKVLNFESLGQFRITAIPHDQLFISKPIYNQPGSTSVKANISTINITANNVDCYVALSTDNDIWYTLDPTTGRWEIFDVRTKSDTYLKTRLMTVDTLNGLTETDYSSVFTAPDQLYIAIFMCIEPDSSGDYDISKTYSISEITLDYVGDPDLGTDLIQYFNFIKVGYTNKGDTLLISDRVIHPNIKFSTLIDNEFVYGGQAPTNLVSSYYARMRLLDSAISKDKESEYDNLIVNASSDIVGNKTPECVFNTNLGTITRTLSSVPDNKGIPASTDKIISRGGLSIIDRFTNLSYNTNDKNHGWRPVVEIDLTSREATKSKPSPVLPVVTSVDDLEKGKCISCDYIYKGLNEIGTFKNLGKSTYGLLTDYKNSASGSFYWICVGYDINGNKICIADRPLQTGLKFTDILKCESINTSKGYTTMVDGCIYKIRLISTTSKIVDANLEDTEWNALITDLGTGMDLDNIWHLDKTANYTSTLKYDENLGDINNMRVVVKGRDDMKVNSNKQRIYKVNTYDDKDAIAFRPIIVLYPQTHISMLNVTPYSAYSKQPSADAWVIDAEVISSKGEKLPYKITYTDDSGTVYVLSPMMDSTKRVISLHDNIVKTAIPDRTGTNGIEVLVDIVINNPDTPAHEEMSITSIPIYKEEPYRRQVSRTKYDEIYGGWNTECVNSRTPVPAPESSMIVKATRYRNSSYISASKYSTKIIFNY